MLRTLFLAGALLASFAANAQPAPGRCQHPSPNCVGGGPSTVSRYVWGIAADGALTTLMPGEKLVAIYVLNTTANAVTGGINLGTTAAGSDIASAFAVGANATTALTGATLLKTYLSSSVPSAVYISTASAWNSASLNLEIVVALGQAAQGL